MKRSYLNIILCRGWLTLVDWLEDVGAKNFSPSPHPPLNFSILSSLSSFLPRRFLALLPDQALHRGDRPIHFLAFALGIG